MERPMWMLLKAELSYNRIYLMIAYAIAVPTLFSGICVTEGFNSMHSPSYAGVLLFSQIMFWSIVFPLIFGITIDRRNSKRTRLFALLCLSPQKQGWIYLFIPLIFWLSLILLFWLIFLVGYPGRIESSHLWASIALTGFMFVVAGAPLYYDLNYSFVKKNQRRILNILGPIVFSAFSFLFVFAMLPPGFPAGNAYKTYLMLGMSTSALGSLALCGLGFLVMTGAIWIYTCRKSYVE